MNKAVYLGLSILEISKIVTYEFRFDCVKPIKREKAKLRYIDTGSSIVAIHLRRRHLRSHCKKC